MSQVADQSASPPQLSPEFAATLQRAFVYADEQAHRQVTAEHLLLALTEDADCVAILRRKSVDLDHLRNEIAGLVSRNTDRFAQGESGQPLNSPDLQRILAHAGGAASARRPVDGALVLAVLIADGRTPAAELIKLYGLTFEDATRGSRPRPDTAATTLPPLGSVRAAAMESTLGLRKRAAALPDRDAPAPAPLPQPPPGRPATQVRSVPAAQPMARPRLVPNAPEPAFDRRGQANGSWPDDYGSEGTDPFSQHPSPQFEPSPPEFGGQTYEAGSGLPETEWPDLAYPQDAPNDGAQWQEPPRQAFAAEPEPPPPRRAPPADATARGTPNPNPTRRGRTGKTSRRKAERGLLVENIPRRMQAGMSVMVEARIGRHDIETALIDLANPGLASGATLPLAQTMTVRLRAEDGGMAIETATPETQWIDGALGLIEDDFASWSWTLTPVAAGRVRLHFVISARSVGEDGLSGEVALPDQAVEVSVAGNPGGFVLRMLGRVTVLALVLAAGVIAERYLGVLHRLLGH